MPNSAQFSFRQRFPFFISADDSDALVELGTIFGLDRLKYTAETLSMFASFKAVLSAREHGVLICRQGADDQDQAVQFRLLFGRVYTRHARAFQRSYALFCQRVARALYETTSGRTRYPKLGFRTCKSCLFMLSLCLNVELFGIRI